MRRGSSSFNHTPVFRCVVKGVFRAVVRGVSLSKPGKAEDELFEVHSLVYLLV